MRVTAHTPKTNTQVSWQSSKTCPGLQPGSPQSHFKQRGNNMPNNHNARSPRRRQRTLPNPRRPHARNVRWCSHDPRPPNRHLRLRPPHDHPPRGGTRPPFRSRSHRRNRRTTRRQPQPRSRRPRCHRHRMLRPRLLRLPILQLRTVPPLPELRRRLRRRFRRIHDSPPPRTLQAPRRHGLGPTARSSNPWPSRSTVYATPA